MLRNAFFLLARVSACVLFIVSGVSALALDDTMIKGDLRLRYQYDKKDDDTPGVEAARHRERIRFRFGLSTEVRDGLDVGMRLASGSDDPRSTNQTLDGFFSTKGFHLDQAYFVWEPFGGLALRGGKFGKAFRMLDDLLWDSDITFEGQAMRLDLPNRESLNFSVNGGMFILDEVKSEGKDPHLFVVQPCAEVRLGGGVEAEILVAYYGFAHIQGSEPDHSAGSNTRESEPGGFTENGLEYDYDSVNPTLGVTRTWESSNGKAYSFRLLGDMVYNLDSEDAGYLVGLETGNSSVKETWSWRLHYNWRRLETDAFPDVFPDSDFYGGATNVSGHELVFNLGLGTGLILGFDYYRANLIEGGDDSRDLLQVDLVVKF
jgi:hypothetical protein